MSTAKETRGSWRTRLVRLSITIALMGISFAVGVAITASITPRVVELPITAMGAHMGTLVGMASASANATTSALYSGDSAMRLSVLTQIKAQFDSEPTQSFDPQTAAWIVPAIAQCKTDEDPDVVSLAEDLVSFVKDRTSPPVQQVTEQSVEPEPN